METQAQPILRPLRLGELLDRAIRLYRGNFLTFIGIIAVVYVPLMVLQTASAALMTSSAFVGTSNPGDVFTNYGYLIGSLSTIVLVLVQFVLVQGIATGALTRAVADNYLGKKTGILEAYRGISGSWLSLVAALLFILLLFFVLMVWWIFIPCAGTFTGLGMMIVLMTVVNPLVAPAVVLENQGALDAVRRAWSLARRRFWPVLGSIFVLYLFSLLIVNGPQAIVNLLLAQVSDSFGDRTMQLVVTSIVGGLVSLVFVLIYYPLQMTAFTLIYFDLRVRTEGFDLAILTTEASGSPDVSEIMTVPVPEVNEGLMTWAEVGNFAILTLGGLGLYILFFSVIMGIALFASSLLR
jgi:hypothetical protein